MSAPDAQISVKAQITEEPHNMHKNYGSNIIHVFSDWDREALMTGNST